jgi:hypothetical protein
MITAVALVIEMVVALAAVAAVRRHDIARQRQFNRAVVSLVLDIGLRAQNDRVEDQPPTEDAP